MKMRAGVSMMVAVAALFVPSLATAQSELFLTMNDGTLQRVLFDGGVNYTLGGSIGVPNISEVALYGDGPSLKIYSRTNAAGNNTIREFSRVGSTLTEERLLDLNDFIATDIDVQPTTGTLTAYINETTSSSRVHDFAPVPGTFVDQTIYSGYGPGVSGKIGVVRGSNPPATPGNVDLIYAVDNGNGIKILSAWAPGNPPPILSNSGYNADELLIDGMAGSTFVTIAGTGVQGTPETRIRVMNFNNPSQIVAENVVNGQFPSLRRFVDLDHLSTSVIVTTSVDDSGFGRLEGHVANLGGLAGSIELKGLSEQGQGGPTGSAVLTVDPDNFIHTLDSQGVLSAYRVEFLPDNNLNFTRVAQLTVGLGSSLDSAVGEAVVPEPTTLALAFGLVAWLLTFTRNRRDGSRGALI